MSLGFCWLVISSAPAPQGCRAVKQDMDFLKSQHLDLKQTKIKEDSSGEGLLNLAGGRAELAAATPGIVTLNSVSSNKRLARYVKSRQYEKTMKCFEQMQKAGQHPDSFTFVPVLGACASLRDLESGRRIHIEIIQNGCDSDAYVRSSLINMYAKCGSIEDAWRVFNKIPTRDVVIWSAMILAFVKCGQGQKALELYRQMQLYELEPVRATFLSLLSACASMKALEEGRHVHKHIVRRGYHFDLFVGSSLVDMYSKCGSILDAEGVFNKMRSPDVVCWNAMILGYVKCGLGQMALKLYEQMRVQGLQPNAVTYVGVLNACASARALGQGRHIHEEVIQSGFQSDVFVGSCLIDMYAKCGTIEDAWQVFSDMPTRGVVAWNALILGSVKCGQGQKALTLFGHMQKDGVEADLVTFVGVLNACTAVVALKEGRRVHEQIIRRGYESHLSVGSCLVDMYVKCGSVDDAWGVFSKMTIRNSLAWNAMILGLVKCGQGQRAYSLFQEMQGDGVEPNPATFVGVLNACASVRELGKGRHVHELIIQSGYESDIYVGTSLVDMYAKCGSIEDAWSQFCKMSIKNVFAWNAIILGLVKCGHAQASLELFQQMQLEGVEPDAVTFLGAVSACAKAGALEQGRHVHTQIIRYSCESDVSVSSSLVDMYTKCGSIEDAWEVFSKMPTRGVVAWTAIILGYVKCGQGRKALTLSQQMQQEGAVPDSLTFVGMLNACASIATLEEGRRVHGLIIQSGCESDTFVHSSLIDMYAKCGSIEDAWQVFSKISTRDAVAWTAMLGGYAMHGDGREALRHFKCMCQENIEVNEVTFVSLLSACSHAGLVDEGLHYFESMSAVYDITPTAEHYDCVVNLLGRAGHLHEAECVIKVRSHEPSSVWISLLGACRAHDNMEMEERIRKQIVKLDPEKNIDAPSGIEIVDTRGSRWFQKQSGHTWIKMQ